MQGYSLYTLSQPFVRRIVLASFMPHHMDSDGISVEWKRCNIQCLKGPQPHQIHLRRYETCALDKRGDGIEVRYSDDRTADPRFINFLA